MTRQIHIFLSLLVFSVAAFAGDTGQVTPDYSQIEATEREYIIKEFSYRLDTDKNCTPVQMWSDKGSGADVDGYFFVPTVKNNFFMIGGSGAQSRKVDLCVITVAEPKNNPENTPKLLAAPVDFKLIWRDKGSGAEKDGSMWEAIPPGSDYKCLGSIPQAGHGKPAISNYRCVHVSLTEKITTNALIWTEKGSHADSKVTIFKLPNTNSFVAVQGRVAKLDTWDLKRNPAVPPDPGLVEEKLAARMEKIKQDLEANLKAEIEKKNQAEKAEQLRLASEAEQKRLAEAARQEQLDEGSEQKRLDEAAKKARLAREAEQKRLDEAAEKARLAREAEQKRLAEAARQEQLDKEAEQKRLSEKAEQMRQPEQPGPVVAEQPVQTDQTSSSDTITSRDDGDKKSGVVTGLIIYLLKITAFVVGLFIFMGFIIYKIIYGSKSKKEG